MLAVLIGALCLGLSEEPASALAGWRTAPVVPPLKAPVRKALVRTLRWGTALGNRADVFAKVGDSHEALGDFLQELGCGPWQPGRHLAVRATVQEFREHPLPGTSARCETVNSFSRNSLATRAGAFSATPLLVRVPQEPGCLPEETPLACEIRVDRPRIALILLGTNDVSLGQHLGIDPLPSFQQNMARIIAATRRLVVEPVLVTIPPRKDNLAAGQEAEMLNAALWRLAVDQCLPVINLWRALIWLPNEGMAPDGLHLSSPGETGSADFTENSLGYGYNVFNLAVLRTLHSVTEAAVAARVPV